MATSKRDLFFWAGLTVLFLGVFFFSQTARADTTGNLFPTADGSQDQNSYFTQAGTACNATTCYTTIDETPASDTDYIYRESAINVQQSFDINESSIPDGSTVTQIDVYFRAASHDAIDPVTVQAVRCLDGSCATFASPQEITSTWTNYSQSFTGLSYSKISSSDIEVGFVILAGGIAQREPSSKNIARAFGISNAQAAGGNPDGAVSQLYAVITYTAGTITVSGNIYTDEGSTAYNCSTNNITVRVKVNGAGTYSGTCTASSGAYSVSTITINAASDVVSVFIDGESILANTITKAANTSSNITSLPLYQNRINIRHEDAGPVTNTNLDQYDNGGDADMLYTVTSGALTVETGIKLVVLTGETYTPGGAVSTPTIEVIGTFNGDTYTHTLTGSGTGTTCTAASGTVMPFCVSGTFNANTSKIVFSGSSATTVENATYYNLDIGGSGTTATYTLDGNTTVSNVLTIVSSSGTNTFSLSSYTLTLSGSGTPLINNETFTASTGTVVHSGSSATNVTAVTYYNLNIGGSGTTATYTAAGNFTVSNVLTIVSSSGTNTFSASSRTITLSGSGTPFVINSGEVFTPSTSTIVYTGSSATNIASTTYYNLQTNGSGTYTAAGTLTVSNDIFLTAGAFDLSASNYALNVTGNLNFDGGTFNMRGSAITVTGNWDSTVATDYDGVSVTVGTSHVYMNGTGTKTILTGSTNTWSSRFYNITFAYSAQTIQMLQNFGVKNITTLTGAGTLDFNGKALYLGNGGATSNANPISMYSQSVVGLGTGSLVFFSSITQYVPSKIYDTTLYVQGSTGVAQQSGQVIANGLYISCCTSRVGTWNTGGYSLIIYGNIWVDNYNSTLALNGSTVTVGGNWTNPASGTVPGTVNYATSTVVFNATDTGNTIKTATSTAEFYNLQFNGSGGAWSFTTPATVTNDLTMTTGTLSGAVDVTVNGGDVTGDATINLTGGLFTLAGTGNFGGATAWTFYDLQFGIGGTNTTTASGSGGTTVTHTLTNYVNQTLNAGSKTWTLSNSIDDTSFTNAGTFNTQTSTVNYTGTSGGSSASVYPANYYNLGVGTTANSNAVTYNIVTSDFTVSNQLTVGNASSGNSDTFNVNGRTLTLSKSGTGASAPLIVTSKGILTDTGSGTVFYQGTDNTEIAAGTYKTLKIQGTALKTYTLGTASSQTITASILYLYAPTSGTSDITYTAATYNPTINITSSLQLNACQEACGTGDANLSAGSGTWTLSGSGTPFNLIDDGGFTPNTSTFVYTHGTSATITATTYYNIQTANGDFTLGGATTVSNDFTVDGNSLSGSSDLTVNGGDFYTTTGGAVTFTAGTVTVSGAGNVGRNSTLSAVTWQFNNLTLSGNTQTTSLYAPWALPDGPSSKIKVTGVFTNGSGHTASLSSSANIELSGSGTPFVNSGTFTAGTGKVFYTGSSATNIAGETYYDIAVGGTGTTATYTAAGNIIVGGDLNVESSVGTNTFAASNKTITLTGTGASNHPFTVQSSEVFDPGTGTVNYTATSSVTLGTTYYNLGVGTTADGTAITYTLGADTMVKNTVIVGNASSSAVDTLNGGSYTFIIEGTGTPMNVTSKGTFNGGSGTARYTGDGETNIASSTYNNLQIVPKTGPNKDHIFGTASGQTIVVNGNLDLALDNSSAVVEMSTYNPNIIVKGNVTVGACVDAPCTPTQMTFTKGSGTITFSPTGTKTWTDSNTTKQDIGTVSITGGSSTPTISVGSAVKASSISIATSHTLSGSQDVTTTTGAADGSGTVNLSGGTFTFAGTGNLGGSSAWTFGSLAVTGTATATSTGGMTVGSVLSISGGTLNAGTKAWTLSGTTGTPLTVSSGTFNAQTSTFTFSGNNGAGNTTIPALTYYNLTLNNGSEIYAAAGGTAVSNDFTITAGTYTAPSTLTIGGNYSNSGTFTHSSGLITFNATDASNTIAPGSSNFNNITFNGVGGGWSFGASATLAGDLTMTAGTLSGTNDIAVQGGDSTGDGTINLTGGTLTLSGTGNFGGATGWTFSGLTLSGSSQTTTASGAGGITVTNALTNGSSHTLSAGSKTWTLTGSGTPFSNSGTFTPATSKIVYGGSSATNVIDVTYYNVDIGGSATTATYTVAGDMTVQNVLTIVSSSGTNTFNGSTRTITLSGTGTPFVISASEVFTEGTSTINYTGAGATNITADTYNNLGVKPGANSTTHTLAAGTIIVGGTFTVGNGTSTSAIVTANINNTTFDVSAMTIAANTTFTAHASNSFSIRGAYTNSGAFTNSSGIVYINGSSPQTFSGTMGGSSAFYDVAVNNTYTDADPETAPSSIYFAGSASSTGTFTMTTASTTARFIDGVNYTFDVNNINWNGGATSSRVYFRSATGGNQWYLHVGGTQTVQNVDAKDSNACRGTSVSATNQSNKDSGNNSCWNFVAYATEGTIDSHIIDTQIEGGVAPNSIKWKGTLPTGTTVKLQVASSNSTGGPWVFKGRTAAETTCSTSSYYTPQPDTWIVIPASCHENQRYFRYRIILETTNTAVTPEVNEVIFNYAR